MPYLFLDFDGVLRPLSSPPGSFDPGCMQRLERLAADFPEIQVVISSSWRLDLPLSEIQALFPAHLAPRIVGATPSLGYSPRHGRYQEVLAFLAEQVQPQALGEEPLEVCDVPWAALDDDPWNYPPETVGRNVMLTDPLQAFDEAAADQLQAILRRQS